MNASKLVMPDKDELSFIKIYARFRDVVNRARQKNISFIHPSPRTFSSGVRPFLPPELNPAQFAARPTELLENHA